jgi:HlyD family type I secretion membrane fusion protein
MIENPEDIQLRSEEVQEILGTPPSWLIRWGTTIVFLVIIGMVCVSWFVKYPDIIAAKVMITTPSQPASVVTRSGGYLERLMVTDKESVTAGQRLAIMESNADVDDILELEEQLKWLQEKDSRITIFQPEEDWKLGNLQASLSRLMQMQKEYKLTTTKRYDLKKIEQLERQIKQVRELKKELNKRQDNQKNVLTLAKKNFERSKTMVKEGLISPKQFEDEEAAYLQKKQQVDDMESQVISYDIQIAGIESQIAEIEQSTVVQNSSKIIQVTESVNQMLSEVDTWKQQYILTAPISGKVSLTIFTEERQFIEAGKEIMTVVPSKTTQMQGNAKLAIAGSGKVEIGQNVNIKLDGFPFYEYGIVHGKVETMSAVPREGHYDVLISLPNGLMTSYKKDLRFQQQMEGTAEIITKERRLIERIFEKLISAFRNQ